MLNFIVDVINQRGKHILVYVTGENEMNGIACNTLEQLKQRTT
jgi:hypothetical protein